jgi:hypothetical protein
MQLALPHSAGATEKKKKRSKSKKNRKKKRSLPHLRLSFRFRKCLDRLRFTDTVALETDAQVHRHCLVRLGSSLFSARPPSVLFFFSFEILMKTENNKNICLPKKISIEKKNLKNFHLGV